MICKGQMLGTEKRFGTVQQPKVGIKRARQNQTKFHTEGSARRSRRGNKVSSKALSWPLASCTEYGVPIHGCDYGDDKVRYRVQGGSKGHTAQNKQGSSNGFNIRGKYAA